MTDDPFALEEEWIADGSGMTLLEYVESGRPAYRKPEYPSKDDRVEMWIDDVLVETQPRRPRGNKFVADRGGVMVLRSFVHTPLGVKDLFKDRGYERVVLRGEVVTVEWPAILFSIRNTTDPSDVTYYYND